jgi:hypothetical protein
VYLKHIPVNLKRFEVTDVKLGEVPPMAEHSHTFLNISRTLSSGTDHKVKLREFFEVELMRKLSAVTWE